MRLAIVIACAAYAWAQSPVEALWKELEAKRRALPGVHQEFDVSRTYTTRSGKQEHVNHLTLDISGDRWRESDTGWGGDVRIYTGTEILVVDEGANEFTRNSKPKREESQPSLYSASEIDWRKAAETERLACGFSHDDHTCVILSLPYKGNVRLPGQTARRVSGDLRVMLDLETGIIVSASSASLMENGSTQYVDQRTYAGRQIAFGSPVEASLFRLPASDPREVKKFSSWRTDRIRKEFAGKPAPPLALRDIDGNAFSLEDLVGKTILLDFWASWCPPCRDDAPDLEKLHSRYGERDMVIIGVNVDESRETVQEFLKEYPSHFATALSVDNELPRVYRFEAIPTYVVIDPNGTVMAAEDGNQGFGKLRKMLKKAGLDVE